MPSAIQYITQTALLYVCSFILFICPVGTSEPLSSYFLAVCTRRGLRLSPLTSVLHCYSPPITIPREALSCRASWSRKRPNEGLRDLRSLSVFMEGMIGI